MTPPAGAREGDRGADFPALIGDVARLLFGEPNRIEADGTWRYGTRGSPAVHVAGDRRGT